MVRSSLLVLLLVTNFSSHAHLMKLFASADGPLITGSVYIANGAKISGAKVQVHNTQDGLLFDLTSSDEGTFTFTATEQIDHVITARTGDGHVAKWIVPASELPSNLAPAKQHDHQHTQPPAPSADTSQQEAAIERAVARQIAPLRQQLITQQERTNLQDILGALGYILGLVGLATWWRYRKQG